MEHMQIIEQLTRESVYWQKVAAIAAWVYVFIFMSAVSGGIITWVLARRQLEELVRKRKLQDVMTIFRELKAQNLIDMRRYILESFPESIEGIESSQLKTHLQKAELALEVFKRIGYLIKQGHIDAEPIMENYWSLIWRCWKKSKEIINWAREQRGELKYLESFKYLFDLAEAYRIENNLQEPKIY